MDFYLFPLLLTFGKFDTSGTIATLGNIFVIVTIVKTNPMRRKPQLLLHLNLAVADLGKLSSFVHFGGKVVFLFGLVILFN